MSIIINCLQFSEGRLLAITFALIGFLLGGLIMKIDKARNHGFTFWGDKAIIDPTVPDEKLNAGVVIGLVAGYWLGTGEEKDPEELVQMYTEKYHREKN